MLLVITLTDEEKCVRSVLGLMISGDTNPSLSNLVKLWEFFGSRFSLLWKVQSAAGPWVQLNWALMVEFSSSLICHSILHILKKTSLKSCTTWLLSGARPHISHLHLPHGGHGLLLVPAWKVLGNDSDWSALAQMVHRGPINYDQRTNYHDWLNWN